MVNNEKDQKPEGFNAFSCMKMQSLWDADKVKAAHIKNIETLKQAHGIVTAALKKVSVLHVDHFKKKHSEIKDGLYDFAEKIKSEPMIQENVKKFTAHYQEMSDKFTDSHDQLLNKFKETMDQLHQHHQKLNEKLQETQQVQVEKIKETMTVEQEHHKAVTNAWKDSTQQIMNLIKSTADYHFNKH